MSIRHLTQSLLILGVGAAQSGVALAEVSADVASRPSVAAAQPRVMQAAQTPTPAKPASLQVGSAPIGAMPVGPGPATLWRFMGIPQGIQKVRGATTNRRGNMPGREPTPPLKAIADPANLDPGKGPAINTAAKIKQKEDLAPQKIKALKYLATIGCGCYPDVKEAFMASVDIKTECTEEVRLQAARSIARAADNHCEVCSQSCCCTPDMMQLLSDIATQRDEKGCFIEPSAAVREAACEALLACRRRVRVYPAPVVPGAPPVPYNEAQPDTVAPPGEAQPDEMPMPPKQASTKSSNRPSDQLISEILGVPASEPSQEGKQNTPASTVATHKAVERKAGSSEAPSKPSGSGAAAMLNGTIVGVDLKTSTVDVEFDSRRQPTVGSQFSIQHDYALSTSYLGRIEIVYLAGNGRAIARPAGRLDIAKVGKGDRVSGRIVETDDSEGNVMTSVSTRGKSRTVHSCVAPPAQETAPYVPEDSSAQPSDETQAGRKPVRTFIVSWIKGLGDDTGEIATSHEENLAIVSDSSWKSSVKPAIASSDVPALKPQTAQPAQPARPAKGVAASKPAAKAENSAAKNSTPGVVLLED